MSDKSGKSKSAVNPLGIRRKTEGKDKAPKSARRLGRKFLSDCSEQDLKRAKII